MTWNGRASWRNAKPIGGSQTQKVGEAVSALEKAIEENEKVLFLWTGGKEAQVIADLLLYEVGEEDGVSPVPFGVIDTGNQFESMYDFREEFLAADGDKGANTVGPFEGIGNKVIVERHDEFLEKIIENENDPRGYHGKHSGEWKCPECRQKAKRDNTTIICEGCGETKLESVQRQNLSPEEWGVPESCGALKVEPLKRFVKDHGFTTMITGIRGTDMIEQGDSDSRIFEEKNEPANYSRINPLINWSEENVWAYIKAESVSYPELYDQGYRHTDSKCCTSKEDRGGADEYGEGGIDAEKAAAKKDLQDMGYV
ncbi:MAG: phosphoadenosine phosphosulfate reductase family protein [Nanohaloarchaea archaeon]|nr:phosphoadenosine phosphosulfate reductase family protein [Candidatus Nanohaloarchaea archaeon]